MGKWTKSPSSVTSRVLAKKAKEGLVREKVREVGLVFLSGEGKTQGSRERRKISRLEKGGNGKQRHRRKSGEEKRTRGKKIFKEEDAVKSEERN